MKTVAVEGERRELELSLTTCVAEFALLRVTELNGCI